MTATGNSVAVFLFSHLVGLLQQINKKSNTGNVFVLKLTIIALIGI
jgi:hypothetical protein